MYRVDQWEARKKTRRGSTKSNVKTDGAEIGGKTSLTQLPDEQI